MEWQAPLSEHKALIEALRKMCSRCYRQKTDATLYENMLEDLRNGWSPNGLSQVLNLLKLMTGYEPPKPRDEVAQVEQPVEPRAVQTPKPTSLQDLTRRLYEKAKAEPKLRFRALYVHVTRKETLSEAYRHAKANNGAPGIDGVKFEAIEERGVEEFLDELRVELQQRRYKPQRNRKKEIPKGDGKTRTLGIPTIRDRVVQGALKIILEPIFEADFQSGSYGYRPAKKAHDAVHRVQAAIAGGMEEVIDLDLKAYFDNVKHDVLLAKVAQRVEDKDVLHLLKLILKASGKEGVPQGGVVSPLLSNLYLNEVDRMLERAKEVTREGKRDVVEYARYADDLVILLGDHPRGDWLRRSVTKRLREEIAKIQVSVNEEKSRTVNLRRDEGFGFLGFDFRRVKNRLGRWRTQMTPKLKKRTALLEKLGEIFHRHRSQPVRRVVEKINPILRGWVNYFRVGNSSRCFSYVKRHVEMKVRQHLMRAKGRSGHGWARWTRAELVKTYALFDEWRLRPYQPPAPNLPKPAVP